MRSFRELSFRIRQELANAVLYASTPNLRLQAPTPLEFLPAPNFVREALRNTAYALELTQTADEIVQGRIPVFDEVVDYGSKIAWRRDSQRGIETPLRYFRLIPYLDLAAAGDHKLIWEINRHQHLVLLAQADVITGREAYRDSVLRQLEHWWEENPFQHGINWSSALEVAFRALSWVWIWHLLGAKMPTEFRQRFLAELHRHGLHLEYNLSLYFSPNTHLLGEAVALHALGRLFPAFPRAGHWCVLAREIIHSHMDKCVKKDGSYFEQSTYYHIYALDMFAFHAVLEDVADSYLDKLASMAEFLASITSGDGDVPFVGDDDGGRFFHPYGRRTRFARGTLAMASLLLEKRFFPFTKQDADEIALWWLGPEGCEITCANAFKLKSHVFPDSGIVVMRSEKVSAVFDAGPFGPGNAGHSHSDTLSLTVTNGDREVLIDSGTYAYMDPEWRQLFRDSSAHNTIRIDGRDQATPTGPFRWAQKPDVNLLGFTSIDGNDRVVAVCRYQGLSHQRIVQFTNRFKFEIIDEIDGPKGEHDIEQFWHFAASPSETTPGAWNIGGVAEFFVEGGSLEEGWRSRCFGSKEVVPVIIVRQRTRLPVKLRAELRLLRYESNRT